VKKAYPILEFDASRDAVIEPSQWVAAEDVPEHCVLCFFSDVIAGLVEAGKVQAAHQLRSEIGTHPVYRLAVNGQPLALFHPGVGAPLAAGFLEELIALGCKKFIACGGAGVLDPDIAVGHLVVPSVAVRDEGTSYHYLPPAREVAANPDAVAAIVQVLDHYAVPHLVGKTWTTDGVYRETPAKVRQRRAEGCLTVEMEAAAFFAVAQFRDVTFGQILYGGDSVGGESWDTRDWYKQGSVREQLFWLAAEACLAL